MPSTEALFALLEARVDTIRKAEMFDETVERLRANAYANAISITEVLDTLAPIYETACAKLVL